MREIGLVKVDADAEPRRPGDPVLELVRAERVAVNPLALDFRIAGMEIEPVLAGHDRKNLFKVGAQLLGRAGFPRIISSDGQSVAERLPGVFEAADVVALPAVDGDGDSWQLLLHFFGRNS